MKRIKYGIALIIGILLTVLLFSYNATHFFSTRYAEDDFVLQAVAQNDIGQQGQDYVITGPDAYLIYDVGKEWELYNGEIVFDHVSDESIALQVFYAGEDMAFSEENSYYTSVKSQKGSAILALPRENIRYVRVDICQESGTSVPVFTQVTATQRTVGLYVKMFLTVYNLALFVCLTLITFLLLLIANYRVQIVASMERHEYLTAFLVIVACATFLYAGYLVADQYYVFYDVASDSLYQTYPNLLNVAERIQEAQWGSSYDFSQGFGAENSSLVIGLENWVCLFGKEHVAYLMGISQWLKVILAGWFAYLFAREYGTKHKMALIAGLGYAFNAEMMIRGSWGSYPNTALLLIIWLTSFEVVYRRKKIFFFPLATVFFFYSLDTYYCVFWGAVLGAYMAFRVLSQEKITKERLWNLCKVEVTYAIFAVLGMADTMFSKLSVVAESDRFNNNVSSFGSADPFSTVGDMLTAFLRTVGLSITGITEDYAGVGNILADPAFYCGILVFLMVPLSIFRMRGKQRIYYSILYAMMWVYLLVVPIRYISNGFAGYAWKYNGVWVIILAFVTSLDGFKRLSEEQECATRKEFIVWNGTVVIALIGLAVAYGMGYVARTGQWIFSIVLVLVYAVIVNLMLGRRVPFSKAAGILCVCVVVEVTGMAWDCVNDRVVITGDQMAEGTFYNGDAQKAVDLLKEEDTDWYRLENKNKVFLCDSLGQGYNGITAYVGGTGSDRNTYNVYRALGMISEESNYLFGSGDNLYVDSLLGVKYFLTQTGQKPDEYGLTYRQTVGNIDVYENELAYPLTYAVSDVMSEEEFMMYSVEDRRKIILDHCIVDAETDGQAYLEQQDLKKAEVIQKDNEYYLNVPDNSVLIIRPKTRRAYIGQFYYQDSQQNIKMKYFSAQCDNEIELCAGGDLKIWFIVKNSNEIEDVDFYYQDADEYYKMIREKINAQKSHAMQVTSYVDSKIQGQISSEKDSILVTSIPYNEKWHVLIDGQEADKMKVNIGFVGAKLLAGDHTVELYYESSPWIADNKFKCIGFAMAFLFMIVVYTKGRKNNEKNIGCSSSL